MGVAVVPGGNDGAAVIPEANVCVVYGKLVR